MRHEDCYAKTIGNGVFGQIVFEHCICVGEIGKRIAGFCEYSRIRENVIGFLCALHDIGKLSPIFQYKIGNDDFIRKLGYDVKHHSTYDLSTSLDPDRFRCDEELFKHSGAGVYYAMKYVGRNNQRTIANFIARHHGFSAFNGNFSQIRGRGLEKYCGDDDMKDVVEGFIKAIEMHFNVDLSDKIELEDADYEMISGFLSIADWIASSEFSGVHDVSSIDFDSVLAKHGFIKLEMFEKTCNEMFGFDLRESQNDVVAKIDDYGFYLVEMGTGNGKTEIALASAYNLIKSGRCGGIYFALPTQVTSNKQFDRVEKFLGNVTSGKHAGLVHSNASQALFERGLFKSENDDAPGIMGSKHMRLWNSVNVGTVDQLLFAILNSKYNFIRSSSLWHKVIIIDEVHCYDSYTTELIRKLKEFCLKFECVVIALSATVSDSLKQKLFDAKTVFLPDYPLLSIENSSGFMQCPIAGSNRTVKYNVLFEKNDLNAIRKAIMEANDGRQILWIENTVRNAQRIFAMIANDPCSAGIETGLMHSKFTPYDRLKNEEHWIELLGKESMTNGERAKHGRILVATQVAEQSLDIDADKLYTRLCPIDAFAQRLGREGRFGREVNEFDVVVLSEHSCSDYRWDASLDWFCSHRKSEYSAFVYPPVILYRTLDCLERNRVIEYPSDYRSQINQVYDGICNLNGNDAFSVKYNDAVSVFSRDENEYIDEAIKNEARCGVTRDKQDVKTRQIQDDSFSALLVRYVNGTAYTLFSGDVVDAGRKLSLEDEIKIGNNLVEIPKEKALSLFGKDSHFKDVFSVELTAIVGRDGSIEFFNDLQDSCDSNHLYSYDSRCGLKMVK